MALNGKRGDREGLFSGSTPRHAIIDIGSNTVRLVVYGGSPRAPTTLLNEKVAARLGRDITRTGELAEEAVDEALRGLRRYALMLSDLGIDEVDVVATAAVREASNGKVFLNSLHEMGFKPRVLSGEEEAATSAWGVIGAFPGAEGVVADLGGGSLELVQIDNGAPGDAVSLPLGTLRLPELGGGDKGTLRKAVTAMLTDAQAHQPVAGDLYLVGGTWRAMAVYTMDQRGFPLTDPHGLRLGASDALSLAKKLAASDPESLRTVPRISTMRSDSMPDAAVLLQVLLEKLTPRRVVVSSWGLREGILYDALEPHAQAQDPLIAGISTFAASRGASPTMAARIASWTVGAVPSEGRKSERLRLGATMLSLAAMQIEPNLRMRTGVDWALHKRWIAVGPEGRAMLAAAICGNGNNCELPEELSLLAPQGSLDQAIGWGLAIRLARRLGARSRPSLLKSNLRVEGNDLALSIESSHQALFGMPNEKDLQTLAEWMGLNPVFRIVDDGATMRAEGPAVGGESAEI